MQSLRKFFQVLSVAVFALACLSDVHAQVTTGTVRGVITDPNGAAVASAKVTITKKSTNVSTTTQTSGTGQFEFNNLPLGEGYEVTIEAQNFKGLTLSDVKVQLNHH